MPQEMLQDKHVLYHESRVAQDQVIVVGIMYQISPNIVQMELLGHQRQVVSILQVQVQQNVDFIVMRDIDGVEHRVHHVHQEIINQIYDNQVV